MRGYLRGCRAELRRCGPVLGSWHLARAHSRALVATGAARELVELLAFLYAAQQLVRQIRKDRTR